jgi:uncharacterized protein YdaU (DUF1376 family)
VAKAYFPLYTSDYLRDTRHLSTKAHGAYLLLLLYLWDCDGEMKESPALIQRVTGMTEGEYRTIWRKDLAPFFIVTNGVITHKRVTKEISLRAEKLQQRCKAAAKGGRKTQEKQRRLKANAQASQAVGLASPFQGERPSLRATIESSSHTASPPSPLEGGGDATDGEHIRHLTRWLQERVNGLMASNVLTATDVRTLKEAVRGGSEDRLLLAPGYRPPDHVAAALASVAIEFGHLPKLKLINGD